MTTMGLVALCASTSNTKVQYLKRKQSPLSPASCCPSQWSSAPQTPKTISPSRLLFEGLGGIFVVLFCFVEIEFCYVAKVDLQQVVLLPQPTRPVSNHTQFSGPESAPGLPACHGRTQPAELHPCPFLSLLSSALRISWHPSINSLPVY